MIVENIFGSPVVRVKCQDTSLWRNKTLNDSIEMMYRSPVVVNRVRNQVGDSHFGAGMTTVGQPYPLITLPGIQGLKEWVRQTLLDSRDALGLSGKGNDVRFKRSWTNRLLKGGYGLCHNHTKIDNYMEMSGYSSTDFRPDVVSIFYADVPENSSNLVFIKDGAPDTRIEEYPTERQHWLQPIDGELVMHSPEVWHAVSTHMSEIPRNVFVFDIDFQ
jgi:hypothetical protein